MIKATKVDWIYDKDPMKYSEAKMYTTLSYDDVINKKLSIMDTTAVVLARENNMSIKVANLNKKWAILRIIEGENEGTSIV